MSAEGEFNRVIRFLEVNNIKFQRVSRRYPYDCETVYVGGHALRHLAEKYAEDRERPGGRP